MPLFPPSDHKPRNWRKTALGVVLLFVAVLELILRVLSLPSLASNIYQLHPLRGWALKPEQSIWQEVEGASTVRTNSFGFRDLERSIVKPKHLKRIAVLGDALIEGKQVARENTFCAQLEYYVSLCRLPDVERVEVLNFGVEGYGTAQEFLVLRDEVWRFAPDLVILAFNVADDLYNNFFSLNPDRAEFAPYMRSGEDKYAFTLEYPDQRLGSRFVFSAFFAGLSDYSLVMRVLFNGTESLLGGQSQKNYQLLQRQLGPDYLLWLAYSPPQMWEMKESWAITEQLIGAIADKVVQQEAEFLLLPIPSAIQVQLDERERRTFLDKYQLKSLDYPDKRLTQFARTEGIPQMSFAEEMRERAREKKTKLYGFPNSKSNFAPWNELGQRVAAEIVARRMCNQWLGIESSAAGIDFSQEVQRRREEAEKRAIDALTKQYREDLVEDKAEQAEPEAVEENQQVNEEKEVVGDGEEESEEQRFEYIEQ